jgi:ribosome-binding protein aMBF1 (putative translation factor)
MTPTRFRECLGLIGWSQRGLSTRIESDERLVRRWASGDAEIPPSVAEWLETLAKIHAEFPSPKSWRKRS